MLGDHQKWCVTLAEMGRSAARRGGRGAVVAVVLVGLIGTTLVLEGAAYWHGRNTAQSHAQFRTAADRLSGEISNVLLRYGDLLAGSAALFHQGVVTRAQYDAYLQAVGFGTSEFPGLEGAGLVQVVSPAQVPTFLAGLRASGISNVAVNPPGQRARYCLGSYAKWEDLRVMVPLYGFDFCTVPALFTVLAHALEEGRQQVLPGSSLSPVYKSDFVLVQPVYSGTPLTVSDRVAEVSGWVLAIVNGPGLLSSLAAGHGVQFLMTTGTPSGSHAESVLRSTPGTTSAGAWAVTTTVHAYGSWTIRYRAGPGLPWPRPSMAAPISFLVTGLLIVVLVIGLLATLATSRRRAMRTVVRTTRSLRVSEGRFRTLVANSSDLIVILNEHAELLYSNPAGQHMLGLVPEEQEGRNVMELIHPDDLDAAAEAFARDVFLPGVHPPATYRFRTGNNEWRRLEVTATNCMNDPAIAGIVINARDVTSHHRLDRAQRTLSAAIQAVVHAVDEATLVADVCQLIVDVGNYRLAWVGAVEHDADRSIRPMSVVGASGSGPIIPISWADNEAGQGPAGLAARTGEVQVVNDLRHAPYDRAMQKVAEENALRSCCAAPLMVGGEVIGVLGMYASEPDEFDVPEVALITELASELAFGIERLRSAASLDVSEERFRTLADAAPIGIMESRQEGGVEYVNARMTEIFGRNAADLMGLEWHAAVHPNDLVSLLSFIEHARPRRKEATTQFRILRPDGELRHLRMSAAPKAGADDRGYVITFEDITDQVASQEELTHQAFHDALTGLPNRELFLIHLHQELTRHRGRTRSKIAVLFLDLDRFKIVNDSLGHETGDAVLRVVGDRFARVVREGETAARFSGDEFVFIVHGISNSDGAVAAAKRLLAQLEEPIQCGDHLITISGSVGIVIPAMGAEAMTILRDADAAMYKAKAAGRNTYALFDEILHTRSLARLNMESELRLALARGEFEVYYQPEVQTATERPMGAEALIRWHHPSGQLVSPLEFIPVAEDSGLIKPIGRFVFEEAVSQLAAWDAAPDGPHLETVSVNLSSWELDDPETADAVRAALGSHGIAPHRVALEVTESAVMADSTNTRRSLEIFKELGLRVAIDDFGTGYSSLAHLHTLPVTSVKIDRSFVERLGSADDSAPVVRAIIEMSHAMGLHVVAEGVSNARLRDLIVELGCEAAQGFFWARPMPAGEFEQWWREAAQRALALR